MRDHEHGQKLKRLRKEIDLGVRDAEANRFPTRSIDEIARSVLDELENLGERPLSGNSTSSVRRILR